MDRQEVYEHVVGALEREFTSGEFAEDEFRVHHNWPAGTVTVVEQASSQCLMFLNVTGAAFMHDTNGDLVVRLSAASRPPLQVAYDDSAQAHSVKV